MKDNVVKFKPPLPKCVLPGCIKPVMPTNKLPPALKCCDPHDEVVRIILFVMQRVAVKQQEPKPSIVLPPGVSRP